MRRPPALAVTLFLLAPLVAEFLLGNLPITLLPMLVLLAPLYGGGALLIRETARRLGRGWPAMVLFAAAYAVVEEGIATMSLFNPHYANAHLMDSGYLPALGISGPWTVSVITLHVVWSIGVPIAIVETLARDRRTAPWLGRPGLVVTAVLFVLGVAATVVGTERFAPYSLSARQIAGTAVVVCVLVALGLWTGRGRRTHTAGRAAPGPWSLGAAALAAGLAFRLLPRDWNPWLTVTLSLALDGLAVGAVRYWSAGTGWGDRQRLALAGGASWRTRCWPSGRTP